MVHIDVKLTEALRNQRPLQCITKGTICTGQTEFRTYRERGVERQLLSLGGETSLGNSEAEGNVKLLELRADKHGGVELPLLPARHEADPVDDKVAGHDVQAPRQVGEVLPRGDHCLVPHCHSHQLNQAP